MNFKKYEYLLGLLTIAFIFGGMYLHSDILKLSGSIVLYPWLTVIFMKLLRETKSNGKKLFYLLLILNNFYLLIDSIIRYT